MIEPARSDKNQGAIRPRLVYLIVAACLPVLLLAAEPAWWSSRGVKTPGASPSDYAAVNQGQLKNIARAARLELNDKIPGGAGDKINSMVAKWDSPTAQTSDYSAVNLGALKALAAPFYDRLIAVGYATAYPWASSTDINDYAMANIGQVKNLFSWDLALTGTDGLPAWWKNWWGRQLQTTINAGDIDPVTGLTYLQDFISGCTPGSVLVTDPSDATALEVYTPLR